MSTAQESDKTVLIKQILLQVSKLHSTFGNFKNTKIKDPTTSSVFCLSKSCWMQTGINGWYTALGFGLPFVPLKDFSIQKC